jgi:hypothetical protein
MATVSLAGGTAAHTKTVRLTLKVGGSGWAFTASGALNCPTACSTRVKVDSLVTLMQRPDTNSEFGGWSGACVGTTPTCVVYVDSPLTVEATFAPAQVQLNAVVSGNGAVSGGGLNCGIQSTPCQSETDQGAAVTLTATPAADSVFSGWGGACQSASSATSCTVTPDAVTDVAAAFSLRAPATTVSPSLTFNGSALPVKFAATLPPLTTTTTTATLPPAPECHGSVCLFAPGALPTLTTLAPPTTTALTWSGGCVGDGPMCLLVVDHDATVTSAPIEDDLGGSNEERCPLSAAQSPCINTGGKFIGNNTTGGGGGGSNSGGGGTNGGGGSSGGGGTSGGSGTNPGTVSLHVSVSGQGVITGPNAFHCGPSSTTEDCYANVQAAYGFTLTATALPRHRLVKWKDSCKGTNPDCNMKLASPAIAIAVFTSKKG